MNWEVVWTCLLIIVARIGDVSLGTVRTICVINGRRSIAWLLGFAEVLIWIFVVATVVGEARENPVYGVAYAFGFACGNFIGISVEQRLAWGEQMLTVFTHQGPGMAFALRDKGFRVTQIRGEGRDGPVNLLHVKTARRKIRQLAELVRMIDQKCFYVVTDVRHASTAGAAPEKEMGGLLSALKRK